MTAGGRSIRTRTARARLERHVERRAQRVRRGSGRSRHGGRFAFRLGRALGRGDPVFQGDAHAGGGHRGRLAGRPLGCGDAGRHRRPRWLGRSGLPVGDQLGLQAGETGDDRLQGLVDGADRVLRLAPGRGVALLQTREERPQLGDAALGRRGLAEMVGHRGTRGTLGRFRRLLAQGAQMGDEILQRPLHAGFGGAGRGGGVEPLGQAGNLLFERVEGAAVGAGAPRFVDLVGEVAQHLLDRPEVDRRDLDRLSVGDEMGEAARGGEVLDAAGQRLDLAGDRGRSLFRQRFDPGLQSVDPVLDLAIGAGVGGARVDLAREAVDLPRQRRERLQILCPRLAAIAQDRVANIVDRRRQPVEVASVGAAVAQPADLVRQGRDLVRQFPEPGLVAAGREDVAQVRDVPLQRDEQGAVSATGRQRIDLGGEMGDLQFEALEALARAVLSQALDLGFDPRQWLQDRLEPVARLETVEARSQRGDHRFDLLEMRLAGGLGHPHRGHRTLGPGGDRRQARAEFAQIVAQRRNPAFGAAGRLDRGRVILIEHALARADIGDGGGEALPAEGQARGGFRTGATARRLGGSPFELGQAVVHRLDRLGDDAGRAILALGCGTLARAHALLGSLDPARDRIQRADRLGARLAGHPLDLRRLGDQRLDLAAGRLVGLAMAVRGLLRGGVHLAL
ncbi:MAG: hypothetical protein B7Z40_00250 [Bosea sp. 12-68-7]|nr:MAG: hypothetical protein B7Z40_00250 [Bosea sp. 12-68-7]